MFYILSIVKSFETFPEHNRYFSISESFVLNWYIFVALTIKKLSFPLQWRLNTNLFPDYVKLVGYWASAFIVVSSNYCVGPSPKIKISFHLLSTCTDDLISAPKIMTCFP